MLFAANGVFICALFLLISLSNCSINLRTDGDVLKGSSSVVSIDELNIIINDLKAEFQAKIDMLNATVLAEPSYVKFSSYSITNPSTTPIINLGAVEEGYERTFFCSVVNSAYAGCLIRPFSSFSPEFYTYSVDISHVMSAKSISTLNVLAIDVPTSGAERKVEIWTNFTPSTEITIFNTPFVTTPLVFMTAITSGTTAKYGRQDSLPTATQFVDEIGDTINVAALSVIPATSLSGLANTATVTFSTPFATPPIVIISNIVSTSGLTLLQLDSVTTTGFTVIKSHRGASTSYEIYYYSWIANVAGESKVFL
eukprot:TRINITY_DN6694_c0_g1_i1.p1 TRINITY_DN6694_c0_g1~~TRINITY_DN6694_c0_g1_i1.p1  ORF type:complete len:311 (+),score=24.79 TRINITY_DN6694_c0_g1_i1:88-1020(+)